MEINPELLALFLEHEIFIKLLLGWSIILVTLLYVMLNDLDCSPVDKEYNSVSFIERRSKPRD